MILYLCPMGMVFLLLIRCFSNLACKDTVFIAYMQISCKQFYFSSTNPKYVLGDNGVVTDLVGINYE